MTTVTLRIQVDKAGATQGIAETKRDLSGLGQAGQQAGQQASGGMNALRSSIDSARAAVGAFLAIYAGIQTLSGVVRLADEYNSLNDRLRLATDSSAEFTAAQQGVFAIAQETGTALGATTTLYTRLAQSTDALGLSQSQLLTITEAINQAFVVSGAGAGETDAAIRQLAQGFASGALRGDEFNSVMENAPRLAKALADSLGVTVGELRNMAAEGKLTSDVLARGLLQQAPAIAGEFDQMGTTVGRAFTQLSNAALKFVGETDQATGASRTLAGFIVALSQNIGTLVGVVASAAAGFAIFIGVRGLLGIVSAAQAAGGAMALMATRTAALLPLLGGIPGLVAAVAAGVFFMATRWNMAAENAQKYEDVLKSLRDVQQGQQVTEQAGAAFLERVNVLLEQREGFERRLALSANSLAGETDYNRQQTAQWTAAIDRNTQALTTLGNEGQAALLKLIQPLRDAFNGVQVATDETQRFAQAQGQLSGVLESAGVTLGKQTKAAQDLQKQLSELAKIEQATPALAGEIEAARSALIAAYQKEVTETPKVTAGMKALNTAQEEAKRAASALAEEQERLTAKLGGPAVAAAIDLAQSLRAVDEQERALRAAHQLTADQVQRLADVRRALIDSYRAEQTGVQSLADPYRTYLASLESERRLLGLSATERARVESQLRAVSRVMVAANTERERGNGLLLDEIAALINAETALDDQAAAAARSQQSAEGWRQYWGDAIGAVTDAFGDFVASGLQSFSDFGSALKNIAKRIVSDLVSTFLRNRIVVPITAALTGGSAAAGPLGGLTGGSGGILGTLGSVFGGIFGSEGLIAGGVGALASGVGSLALSTGSGLLGSIAGGLGSLASVAGPIGAALAGIAALTSLFRSKKPPDLRFGGTAASVRSEEGQFSTVFGTVRAGSRQLSYQELIQPIQQFDAGIASLVETFGLGQQQLDAISQAVSRWSVDLRGDAATAENVLGSRFSAILTAFDADVQAFVGSAGTVEQRVQRLGDALTIASIAAGPNGITGSFTELADLLTEFREGSESLGDTFARIRGGVSLLDGALGLLGGRFQGTRLAAASFSAELIKAAGGFDAFREQLSGALNALFTPQEQQEFLLRQSRQALDAALSGFGLDIGVQGLESIRQALRTGLRNALESGDVTLTQRYLAAGNALNGYLTALDALGISATEAEESIFAAVRAFREVPDASTAAVEASKPTPVSKLPSGGQAAVQPTTTLEAQSLTNSLIGAGNTVLQQIEANTRPVPSKVPGEKAAQNTDDNTRRMKELLAELVALFRQQYGASVQVALKSKVGVNGAKP